MQMIQKISKSNSAVATQPKKLAEQRELLAIKGDQSHKAKFAQLLDDAVLGVKKK